MRPFDIKLSYNGKSWMTLPLEVGHNEIGNADEPDMVLPSEAAEILFELGFPKPGPIPCMRLEHQIAQKLHAVSSPGSERAHDLVGLQIAVKNGCVDYSLTRSTCVRLFDYRQEQGWPPVITGGESWGFLYAAQASGLDVLPTVDEAVAWANELVAKIEASA